MDTKKIFSLYIICLLSVGASGIPVTAHALPSATPEQLQKNLKEVLQQPEFQRYRKEYRWRYIGEINTSEPTKKPLLSVNFISFLAEIFEALLWIFLGLGVIVVAIYARRWILQQRIQTSTSVTYQPVTELFTLPDGQKIILPTDIVGQAYALWQAGESRKAISLLYRGTLSILVTQHHLSFQDSATEGECLRLVKCTQTAELTAYFAGLTRAWQNIAYAERLPPDAEVQRLCEEWRHYFNLH